jgi:DNA primase catalytic core
LKRVGRNWVGLCPFHKEKTPSFSVNAERQFYHCFSCKVGGDVFKFVQETEKLEFLEAVEVLSRRAGIPVPERRGAAPESGGKARLLETLEAAASAYEQWLADPERGAATRSYLERRGVTRDSVRAFRLGLAPAGWENLAQRLGPRHGDERLLSAGLGVRREGARGGLYDRFRNRLMVPLVVPGGAVVGFGARALAAEDVPKYLNSPETPVYHKGSFLYAMEQARKAIPPDGEVIVVEGYFDAIALHQAGLANTVATSGTALTADQARLLKRLATRVALTYDGDAAGQDAMMRSLGVLLGEGLEVAIVELPAGADPDTLVRERGAEGWREARARAYDAVVFVERHVLRAGGTRHTRDDAIRAVLGLIKQIPDEIGRLSMIHRANQVFGLPVEVIRRALTLESVGQSSKRVVELALKRQSVAEHRAAMAFLMAPRELEFARSEITSADFENPSLSALMASLWAGESLNDLPQDLAQVARELITNAEKEARGDWNTIARIATLILAVRRLRREERELEERMSRCADEEERKELLAHLEEIVAKATTRRALIERLSANNTQRDDGDSPEQVLENVKAIIAQMSGQTRQ